MKTTRYTSLFFALKARHILKRTCTELNQKSVAPHELPNEKPKKKKPIVKSVCNGAVYIGHPVYYGYWTTLRKYCHTCSVKLICIKRSPLYNGCGHPLDSQNAQFRYILPVYNGQQIGLQSNHEQTSICVFQSRRKKWMLAKSSNQLTFSWQSNGGTTNVEWTQHSVEFKGNLYIYITVNHFSRVTAVIDRFDCTQYFPCNMVKERRILCS